MLARKPLKAALAAAVLCGGLALTACGSTQGATVASPAPASASATASAAPSNAPSGYASPLGQQGLPTQWQGAPGWKLPPGVTGKSVVSVGGLIGYVTQSAPQQLQLVDSTGSIVYSSEAPKDFTPANSHVDRVSRQGKAYLVYVVEGTAKADPTSVVKPGPVASATVFGEDGKVVSSGVFPGVKSIGDKNGFIAVTDGDTAELAGPAKELDVLTGKIVPFNVPKGFEVVGASDDGVKIFMRTDALDNAGEVTNGTWSIPADYLTTAAGITTAQPLILGKYVEVQLRTANSTDPVTCGVFDAATGAKVSMGPLDGKCFDAPLSSPDGSIFYATTKPKQLSLGEPIGVYSIADGKYFGITPDVQFKPVTISDKGEVYGDSAGKVAYLDLRSGNGAHVLPGVSEAPVLVTASGIGVFDSVVALPKP